MAIGEMIRQFTWEVLDSNAWLIAEAGDGLLVDPVDSPALYAEIEALEGLTVILTHCHFDHICGLNRIRKMKPQAHVIATAECSERIQRPGGNLSNIADALMAFHDPDARSIQKIIPFTCAPADEVFRGQMRFQWRDHDVTLTEYNGHVMGGLCCAFDGVHLFTGDTLLPLPTVTRLPGGSTKRFWNEDMPRLEALRGHIEQVYPGHGVPGHLEDMLLLNQKENVRR